MRIVFAGTPEFAVPSLRAAAARGEVVAVYTQPDRPAGRGRGLQASPVKLEALQRGIPVLQPESLKSQVSRDALRALEPDLMIVVAYGLLLPQKILDIPRHGCWNVHASLLPRWRGAAPIQRAIEAGDAETGVCLMQMEKGLDTGPVMLSQRIAIGDDETSGQLHDRLAALGARRYWPTAWGCCAQACARCASGSAWAWWMRTRSPSSCASATGHGLNARTLRARTSAGCDQSSFASALSSLCA